MAMQMQKMISSCKRCMWHEGTHAKAPMQPIIATAALELLHVDFTSIEMSVELDQPPNVVNILVFCDHFTKHIMTYMTPNQTLMTVGRDTSQSLEPWPSFWAIGAPILKVTLSKSCGSSLAYRRLGLHLTTLSKGTGWARSPNAYAYDRENK